MSGTMQEQQTPGMGAAPGAASGTAPGASDPGPPPNAPPPLNFVPPPTLGGLPMHADHVLGNASAASAHFDKIKEVHELHQRFSNALDELAGKGLAVSPEDVIKKAGDQVAKGADPMILAGVLADMPSNGGEALATWIQQHAADVKKRLAQTQGAFEQSRHAMGVGALQALVHHSLGATQGPSIGAAAPAPGALPNPLMAGMSSTSAVGG